MGRYSFGTGAQMLPIPELMPFRLTRQMRGALQPHDARELLKTPIALGLAALRSGSGVLEVRLSLCKLSTWGDLPYLLPHSAGPLIKPCASLRLTFARPDYHVMLLATILAFTQDQEM